MLVLKATSAYAMIRYLCYHCQVPLTRMTHVEPGRRRRVSRNLGGASPIILLFGEGPRARII